MEAWGRGITYIIVWHSMCLVRGKASVAISIAEVVVVQITEVFLFQGGEGSLRYANNNVNTV